MKRSSAEDTQMQSEPAVVPHVGDERAAEVRADVRQRRGAAVRRKYDFSVIRSLRHQKGLTIEKFAKVCGLSYAPISRIETNLIKPNLDTLDKIAEGLGITTHSLVALAEKRDAELQKAEERRNGAFSWKSVNCDGVEVVLATARKGSVSAESEIKGPVVATVVVRSGVLQARVSDKVWKLQAGEALHFESSFAHQFTAIEDCEATVVYHPRT